jgi:hypothetical protein
MGNHVIALPYLLLLTLPAAAVVGHEYCLEERSAYSHVLLSLSPPARRRRCQTREQCGVSEVA